MDTASHDSEATTGDKRHGVDAPTARGKVMRGSTARALSFSPYAGASPAVTPPPPGYVAAAVGAGAQPTDVAAGAVEEAAAAETGPAQITIHSDTELGEAKQAIPEEDDF